MKNKLVVLAGVGLLVSSSVCLAEGTAVSPTPTLTEAEKIEFKALKGKVDADEKAAMIFADNQKKQAADQKLKAVTYINKTDFSNGALFSCNHHTNTVVTQATSDQIKAIKHNSGTEIGVTDPDPSTKAANPGSVNAMNSVSYVFNGNNQMITSQLANAHAEIFRAKCPGLDVGFVFTGSLPTKTATLTDFARQEVLLADGGFLNAFISLRNLPTGVTERVADDYKNNQGIIDTRVSHVDRAYPTYAYDQARAGELWGYFSYGGTFRAIRTQLVDPNGGTTGMGGAFFGFGMDGPLLDTKTATLAKPGTQPSGTIDIQARLSAQVLNGNALKVLFPASPDMKRTIITGGFKGNVQIIGGFSINFEYSSALGANHRKLGDVSVFSIKYDLATAPDNASTANQVSPGG